jgi:hypothetical protein
VVVGLVFTGATLVADDHEADKAKSPTPDGLTTDAPTPAEVRFRKDVTFLAADAQEGRAPGTSGIEASAQYIADIFRGAGLKPAPGAADYFQPFTIGGHPVLGKEQVLAFAGPDGEALKGKLATDFMPLAIGSGATLDQVPIVIAGYGITAKDGSLKLDYDDYAGIDVKGKAVLIIRREPQQDSQSSPFAGKQTTVYATFQHKATNAFQHGAAAVLFVNSRAELEKGEKDQLLHFTAAGPESTSTIPFVMLSREFGDKLLAEAGEPSLAELENTIDEDLKPHSHELKKWTLSGRIAIERTSVKTKNVVGVLEGVGPHANETVVIGGHYDHLGRGGFTSGSLAIFSKDIHNGADDNASGTSMVMEMARRLGARRDPLPRRVVFIAFSGEERGLLGSQYYVEHPLFPLKSTVMMVNCDMVGRLNTDNELTMIGTGTTQGIDTLVDVLGKSAGLKIKHVAGMTDGFGGSDHQSFYIKDVPVLFAFTGVHSDYHRPTDDSDRINYGGMARIADYLELILLDLIRRPERPALIKMVQQPRRLRIGGPTTKANVDPARTGASVTMGTMPDYEYKAGGMKLTGVRDDGPAQKAGLKGGDIIVRFGGKPIGTLQDYMESTHGYKPGDQVEVVVKRADKEMKLTVTLEGRSAN